MKHLVVLMVIFGADRAAAYDCVTQGGTACADQLLDGRTLTTRFDVPDDACAPGDTFTGVELTFQVVHSQPGDLVATLEHDGVEVGVNDVACCAGYGWSPRFTDTPSGNTGCAQTLQSAEPLAAFTSGVPGGTWILRLEDQRRGETGALVNWGVDIVCTPPVVEPEPELAPEETPDPEAEAVVETVEPPIETVEVVELEPNAPSVHVHGSTACNGGGLGGLALSLLSFLSVLLLGGRARAQESGEHVEVRYHAPVPGGDANLVNVHGAGVLSHLRFSAGAFVDYAVDPLVLTVDDGTTSTDVDVIADELRVDVLFAIGFADVLELGLALPVVLSSSGDTERSAHVGDLRVVPKWRIAGSDQFGIALAVPVSVPTSGDPLSGAASVTFEPRLVGELDLGRARVLGNVGYRVSPEEAALYDLEVGNELRFGLGAAVDVAAGLQVIGEGILKIVGDGETPAELAIGARYGIAGHAVTALAGFGVSEGYGTPAWHLTFGYTFTQSPPTPVDPKGDEDGDGIVNSADGCVTRPEDKDGRDDFDGCPDLDDDGDGIADLVDGPKDEYGFGSCKDIAEDADGFDDADGCIDPDNDGDGILDVADECPLAAESFNDYQDADGCPDVKRAAIGDKQIDLYETVLFETGKDNILPESDELLAQVATILKDHPEVVRVEVAGHTDEVSGEEFNQGLSERRAKRVRDHLIGKGVAAERLIAKGYGERQPLTKETTPEALQKNRRVEFRILERK